MNHFKTTLLMTSLCFGANTYAGTVRNGANLTNQILYQSLQQLETTLEEVTSKQSNQFTAEELRVLNAIKKELPNELKNDHLIELSDDWATFVIDGEEKVAYTSDDIGGTIHVNARLLERLAEESRRSTPTYQQTVQLLVHELGHHHKIEDHSWLDQLGAKVSRLAQSSIPEVTITECFFTTRDGSKDYWAFMTDYDTINAAFEHPGSEYAVRRLWRKEIPGSFSGGAYILSAGYMMKVVARNIIVRELHSSLAEPFTLTIPVQKSPPSQVKTEGMKKNFDLTCSVPF